MDGVKVIKRNGKTFFRVGIVTQCFVIPEKTGARLMYGQPNQYSNLGAYYDTEAEALNKARQVVADYLELRNSLKTGVTVF